mgnify:CR=1 FL=1
MIEMGIVISIIVVMSTILYANYHDINKQGDIVRASESLKNELRRAQSYSLNHNQDNCPVNGWGVYLNRLSNTYVVFADKDNDKEYTQPVKYRI